MKNEIMLSVVIISYNQAEYIRDAIDSVVNQKTKYKYEILLADDCSSDNTKEILSEYKLKFPKLIKVLPRPHNLGGTANSYDACCCAKGKYICVLEGDDYWCDDNKIEKLISFLSSNPDYCAVSHLQKGIDSNNNCVGVFPNWIKKDSKISMGDFLNERLFSLTGSISINYYLDESLKKKLKIISKFSKNVGDYQKCVFLLDIGNVYVKNSVMMVYRCRNDSNNYNSRYSTDEICVEHLQITYQLDSFYSHKYNFFQKYLRYFTIGFFYCLLKHKFSCIKMLNKELPSNKKIWVYLCVPYMAIRVIIELCIRKIKVKIK